MKKRRLSIPLILGIVLILCSVLLMVVLQVRMLIGSEKCKTVISHIGINLPERTIGVPGVYQEAAMPVWEIDGEDYIGLLEIPTFNLTTPVADQWDSNRLYLSPRRYYGSAYDGSLVLGGADYPEQFTFCDQIQHGDVIYFVDMTGAQFSYTVSRIDRSKTADNDWLLDDNFDLTIFCRDMFSMEYIAVRCTFSYK